MIKKRKMSYLVVIYIYWIALLVWQNLRIVDNHSFIDIGFKFCLLLFLLFQSIGKQQRTNITKSSLSLYLIFVICQIATFLKNNDNDIVNYIYPILVTFIFYVLLFDLSFSKTQFFLFFKLFIYTNIFLVLYCVIYQNHVYLNLFSISQAYGNQLKSILYSNHEFAMYLVYGIYSCLICIHFETKTNKKKLYILLIVLFTFNLILTFSRTALFAFLCSVFGIIFLYNKRRFILICVIVIILTLAILTIEPLLDLVNKIILREFDSAGRIGMLKFAFIYFMDNSFISKILGDGYTNILSLTKVQFNHSSFHNAYIQVLLVGGISMLFYLLIIVGKSIKDAIHCIKKDRLLGTYILGLTLSAIIFMLTNTAIYFSSTIDSYILTVFSLLIPMFMKNSLEKGLLNE